MISIRKYEIEDLSAVFSIWNDIVEDGIAFPQIDPLEEAKAVEFFAEQDYVGVAVDENNSVLGFYILHPNNVGRCGHIGNCSYGVKKGNRGKKIGEKLVLDSIEQARNCGFKLIQFNAVVDSNKAALHLYTKLGFQPLGVLPKGFLMKDGQYEDIHLFYYAL